MITKTTSQSLVITAYRDLSQLYDLVSELRKRFNIFIHIDLKANQANLIDRFNKLDGIYAESVYSITWGSYNHLLSVIRLLKKSQTYTFYNGFIHIISGQDIPVKSYEEFKTFFKNNDNIYITCQSQQKLSKEILNRFQTYNFFWKFNAKNYFINKLYKASVLIQRTLHISRKKIGKVQNIAKGMIWGSYPKFVIDYIINFWNQNPDFQKDLKLTYIPEEICFQSILINSKFKKNIVNNNLRYEVWEFRNGSIPAILDKTDIKSIANSNCFFARKIDKNISYEVYDYYKGCAK